MTPSLLNEGEPASLEENVNYPREDIILISTLNREVFWAEDRIGQIVLD